MQNITNETKSSSTHLEIESHKTLVSSKIPEMFRNAKVSAFCTYKDGSPTLNWGLKTITGIGAGITTSILAETTGAATGLHEVVGHGLLGCELTSASTHPTYQIPAWDNFDKMTNSGSFKEGFINFYQWLFSPSGGTTFHSSSDSPNEIGQKMGAEGQSAWISVAGSLPGLAVDTLAVTGGMQLRKRSPILGNTMVTFGLLNNMTAATYPISAAMMNHNQMEKAAENGHDFANFALQMSAVTGLPAQDIAISTAAFWTGFVPLVAAATYMHTKSHIVDVVPDVLALQHWIQKAETDPKTAQMLETYYQKYSKKEQLLKISEETLYANPIFIDFIDYLLDKIPSKTLNESKTEILANWEKNLPRDRIQTALTTTAVVGITAAVAAKLLGFLALATPSLQTAATVLTYLSPIFIGASVISAAYQVYKDFQCPDSIVPKKAKMLSIANLVMTIASAVLITTALFVPGLNLAFLGAILLGCIVNIALSYKRSQIIREQFAFTRAISPEIWNIMYPLWYRYECSKADRGRTLKTWTSCTSKNLNLYKPLTPLEMLEICKQVKKVQPS